MINSEKVKSLLNSYPTPTVFQAIPMKLVFTTILLTCNLFFAHAQKFTISGYIKDAASGENLIGANIFDTHTKSGTSTNQYGFYSITLPTDSIRLIYSFVGYGAKATSFYLDQDTTINIELVDNALLEEIVISADEVEKIQEVTQMSTVSVPIEQIKSLPALLGEVDVLKALQLLPGVQSGSEGTSGLYVRGGGPDQNLILLDGVPVYNASHLFGFFSVFNADAINNVQLIKGGFPSRYGGRLSSVIDINMKEGNMKEFHGEGSVGLIAAKLTLEGPIVKDKTSFIVSGRRTYLDVLARPLIKAAAEGDGVAGYFFYDLNAKVNHKFSNQDRIYLSAYLGDDKFYFREKYSDIYDGHELNYTSDNGLQWGNLTSALRWNHMYSSKLFSNLTLTYSRYRFDIFANYEAEYYDDIEEKKKTTYSKAAYLSGINDIAAKIDFDYIPSPSHYVRFGANAIRHTFNPGAFNIVSTDEAIPIDTTLGASATHAVEYVAYVEDDLEITDRLKVNAGLHFSGFYVNQTFYKSLQPRIAARYFLANELSIKASYARMTQYIHLLTNSGIGLPTDLWVPATGNIPPQDAQQVALGLAKGLRNQYEVSLEGYYKNMKNLIEYKEGASFVSTSGNWQNKVEVGAGRSYGAELLVQKKEGRTTGWLGYTLSKSDRQFDNLNQGNRFPYKYDRRHDVGLAVVHHWKEKVDLSFSWVFGTGNATSLPSTIYAGEESSDYYYHYPESGFNPSQVYYYGERNSFRMRSYHRLDLGIAFKKKTKWGERTWTVGVYNAYSRRNPFFIYLSEDGEYINDVYRKKSQFKQVSLFPFIPSISYSFKF